jgi:hypothetical protein
MIMDQRLYMTFSYPHMDLYDLEHILVLWTLLGCGSRGDSCALSNGACDEKSDQSNNPMKPCMHAPNTVQKRTNLCHSAFASVRRFPVKLAV